MPPNLLDPSPNRMKSLSEVVVKVCGGFPVMLSLAPRGVLAVVGRLFPILWMNASISILSLDRQEAYISNTQRRRLDGRADDIGSHPFVASSLLQLPSIAVGGFGNRCDPTRTSMSMLQMGRPETVQN